ncbi:MAG: GyrI-like domain-containing protein [Nitrososphaerales archaeon]|jgi:effector-binding domain-containing protein
MVVDFEMRKAPEFKLATRTLKGPWPGDRALRSEYEKVLEWAKGKGMKTGKWFFREFDDDDTPPALRRWEAGIQVLGKEPVRGGKGVSVVTLPACTVATVTFNPDQVSPRVVYHGMTDWLRWREKAGEYKESGTYREVYVGNPWSSRRAWAHTQVQVPVKKLTA